MKTVWCDAQVFNNGQPGQDAWCCVVLDDSTESGKLLLDEHLGDKPINASEYMGVIRSLEWGLASKERLTVITDSEIVYQQVYEMKSCGEFLTPFKQQVRELLRETQSRLQWEPRRFNKAGWYYENKNKKKKSKAEFSVVHIS